MPSLSQWFRIVGEIAVLNSYSLKMFPISGLKWFRYLRGAVYVRFAVAEIHEHSQRGVGVFQALYRLRDAGKLYPYEEEHLRIVSEWFNTHLEKPARFTAAKPPYYRKKSKAISWFRDTAHEHIARIREMVAILENHSVSVRMLKTDRVGYVVHEDEHQVVAEPFSDVQF